MKHQRLKQWHGKSFLGWAMLWHYEGEVPSQVAWTGDCHAEAIFRERRGAEACLAAHRRMWGHKSRAVASSIVRVGVTVRRIGG